MTGLRAILVLGAVVAAWSPSGADWLQWGGPSRDFRSAAGDLADRWPEEGPRRLWSRDLGDGYSGVLADGGRLYTAYRADDREIVVCLDAATGETIWEKRHEHGPHGRHQSGYGSGPRSTPLIVGDRLFTIGVGGHLLAMKKSDGELLWSRELWGEEFDGNLLSHGYSSSPIAHGDTVIALIGGPDAGLAAFDQKDGSVRWKTEGLKNSYSTPSVVEILGEEQLLVFMAEALVGVGLEDGGIRWRYDHVNQWGHNISPPVVLDGDTIFLSSPQVGARGLRLERVDGGIRVEEIWSARRIQFYHGTSIRRGDWVYGSTGMMSPAFLTAVNIRTGEIAWRERGMAKANCVEADGKLVILDEDGVLYLASVSPEKLTVHAKTQLLDGVAWTAPTIVGKTLYVRDNRKIVALDLG